MTNKMAFAVENILACDEQKNKKLQKIRQVDEVHTSWVDCCGFC